METEGSLPCSQVSAFGHCHELNGSSPQLTNELTNQPTNQPTNCKEQSPS
jgi:hypothetical protein